MSNLYNIISLCKAIEFTATLQLCKYYFTSYTYNQIFV